MGTAPAARRARCGRMTRVNDEPQLRLADFSDAPALVRLRDDTARRLAARGVQQWQPGEKDEEHFRRRMTEGEVWLAEIGGTLAGAWELWWEDEAAWGPQPPVAGYVHRLMTAGGAPRGTGARLLAAAEERIAGYGRRYSRLDCSARNARLRDYYLAAGYTVVGEQPATEGGGSPYPVTLLEKRLP